jgi:bifunctional non-homologous end joining protein LigD
MPLNEYRKKRDFKVTPEPSGAGSARKSKTRPLRYVVQKHRATALHYDFRLEWNGVMLSWAVPKGPSLDPSTKRLAVQVEDHPIDYSDFEGVIPGGEYGGGTVMIWDTGSWVPEVPDVDAALTKGELKFSLKGKKLKGSWVLVRTRGYGKNPSKPSWLLIKHKDEYATKDDVTEAQPRSAISKRKLAEIARDGGGDAKVAATGDPK